MLPFKPTGAQKRVLGEIAKDMQALHPMSRLLQGDVGSGKTLVAAEAAVIAIENGYQTVLLAPTEILASQHYFHLRTCSRLLGYVVVLLTGTNSAREKEQLSGWQMQGQLRLSPIEIRILKLNRPLSLWNFQGPVVLENLHMRNHKTLVRQQLRHLARWRPHTELIDYTFHRFPPGLYYFQALLRDASPRR